MKHLIVIVLTLISLVKLPTGAAQTTELQFYVLTNSLAESRIWRLDTSTLQAIEVFSLPVQMGNATFRSFMPDYELQAAQEYFQSLQLPGTEIERFLEYKVYSFVKEIDVSDSGNKVILLVTHETCYPNRLAWDACFGISQLILLTESDEIVVWEHAYHDPNPDFLADDCSTVSTLAYKSQILSIEDWTDDEQGVVVGIGGDSCFIYNDHPYVMVPFEGGRAFTLLKGHTPARSPGGDQWVSISRICLTSLDCQDSLVVVNVTNLETRSINSTTMILDNYSSSSPDHIQWNENYGIQFRAVDQLQGSEFLATVDLATASINYVATDEPYTLVSGQTTRSFAKHEVLSILELQGENISFTPFYSEPVTTISLGPDDLLMVQAEQGSHYKIIDSQGEVIEEINLLDYFPNADDYTRLELAW